MDKLYKCRAQLIDEHGNLGIHYDEFKVIGQTQDYYIIKTYCKKGSKKVQKESKNGYAFDTKEKALFNFLKRRQRYAGILEHFREQNKLLIKSIEEQLDIKEVPFELDQEYSNEIHLLKSAMQATINMLERRKDKVKELGLPINVLKSALNNSTKEVSK